MVSPPAGLVVEGVQFVVMGHTQRHGELVTDLLRQPAGLGKGDVMGMTGKRRSLGSKSALLSIEKPPVICERRSCTEGGSVGTIVGG